MKHEMEYKGMHGDGSITWECPSCGLKVLQRPDKDTPDVLVEPEGGIDPEIEHIAIRDWMRPFNEWLDNYR